MLDTERFKRGESYMYVQGAMAGVRRDTTVYTHVSVYMYSGSSLAVNCGGLLSRSYKLILSHSWGFLNYSQYKTF